MMSTHLDEYVLAVRARDGDREALAALVDHLRLWLFAVAYAELGHYDDAQDAVASALLRACQHIGSLRKPAQMRSWMAAIVRNEAHRLSRLRARCETQPPLGDADPQLLEPAAPTLRLDIERALCTLPANQARALGLFYLGGVSVREIARRTGRPEGTVKSWLHHGRRHLARELKEYSPMSDEWTATIISTELEPPVLEMLTAALRAGGWTRIDVLSDFTAAASITHAGAIENREFHLPAPLSGSRFILLDEWIEGRSAFELLPILNAAEERKSLAVGLLVERATEITTFAAWASGVDMFLDKPIDEVWFQRFAERTRAKLEEPSPSS